MLARADGVALTDVSLRFHAPSLSEKIWIFGDSYLNFTANTRWPYYAKEAGYTDYAMFGYPGMASAAALDAFKWAVEDMGYTPQYAVWLMGMNNGDVLDTNIISASWLSATEEFLGICEEKGITPILSTVPSTPIAYNVLKNEWVRNSGYRYIDMAAAVGEYYDESLIGTETEKSDGNGGYVLNKTGYDWYEGMLSTDQVHPAALGAMALYMQIVIDFPELVEN